MYPSAERHWNTWDPDRPTAMVHLPTGLTVSVSAYSTREGTFHEWLTGQPGLKRLDHATTGAFVRMELTTPSGNSIEVQFGRPDPFLLLCRVRVLHLSEWGLRFWTYVAVENDPQSRYRVTTAAPDARDPPTLLATAAAAGAEELRLVTGQAADWHFAATVSPPAIYCRLYTDRGSLRRTIERGGYFAAPPRVTEGTVAAFHLTAQTHPDAIVAVGLSTDAKDASQRAHQGLPTAGPTLDAMAAEAQGEQVEAWRAIRDVVGWNTIWDTIHARALTTLTRSWIGHKFGGWGVWLNDMLIHALLAAHVGDSELARANLAAALEQPTAYGNLPCLRTRHERWWDRSQPPLAAFILWRLVRLTGEQSLIREYLPTLLRAHRWWRARRDGNSDGLLEFGSTSTGRGAYAGTKQAALDEAAMDNLPALDEAQFDAARGTLDLAEPGLNSLAALDAQALGWLAATIGQSEVAGELRAEAEALNRLVHQRLWDPQRRVFAGRRWDGTFVRSLAPTSFFPMASGACDGSQADDLITRWLCNEDEFWGVRVLPSSARSDPATADNVYWRGRIWAPLVFIVWEGLRRSGHLQLASQVSSRSWQMFLDGWRHDRCSWENYHACDAALDPSPDADEFYSWSALLPLMEILDQADAVPWGGLLFCPRPDERVVLTTGDGAWSAGRAEDAVTVERDGQAVVRWRGVGRVRVDDHGAHVVAVTGFDQAHPGWVEVIAPPGFQVVAMQVDGILVEPEAGPATDEGVWCRVEVAGATAVRSVLVLRAAVG